MYSEKLYVVLRKDLSPSQRIVQAGHAIAQYMLEDPIWKNTTLVCLGVKNLGQLEKLKTRLDMKNVKFSEFREPDINDELTAIASDNKCELFERLNLI